MDDRSYRIAIIRGKRDTDMIPAGYSQVSLEFTGAQVPLGAAVVFGVANGGAMTPTQIATFVDGDLVSSGVLNRTGTATAVTNIHVKNGPDATGPFVDFGTNRPGLVVGQSTPSIALLVNKATGLGGRKQRGRMYWPGILEVDVNDGGILTTTAQTQFQTQFAQFLADLTTDGIPMVLLHTDATTPTTVTSLNVAAKVATQRRRLRR